MSVSQSWRDGSITEFADWKPATILTGSNSAKASISGLKKWKVLDAERWKVLDAD